jgi:predicted RecA/RadA family phage recombinase
MSKSFVQRGEVIDVLSAAAYAAGDGVLIGQLFGIAETATTASGQSFALRVAGVVRIKKDTSLAINAGDALWWVPASSGSTRPRPRSSRSELLRKRRRHRMSTSTCCSIRPRPAVVPNG